MVNSNFLNSRKSKMLLNEVYFWTATVKDWKRLFRPDKYKRLIVDQLIALSNRQLILLYGFVIMSNHIHLIWEPIAKNGKEMPHASFNKAVGHEIIKDLKQNHSGVLPYFKVNETERQYRVWQRDSLAVLMDDQKKVEQKLVYIHTNPLQGHWNLATSPEDYQWSSAEFYEKGIDKFGFLTHYKERF